MRRWAIRAGVALLVVVAVLAAPIVWIESRCMSARVARAAAPSPLANEPGYARRASDSYLTYPEWHIVYAYDDLAAVLARGDEIDFAFGRKIVSFWESLCTMTHVATGREAVSWDTRVMLYTIGWSFTAEMAIKGAYERTVGRAFAWWRGPDKTPEDLFVARDMARYAAFLRQTPWYEYPFATRLAEFWRGTPLSWSELPRRIERRVAFSLEYGVKAIYGALIGRASAAALGTADLKIQSVVSGRLLEDREMRVVRDLGQGRTLIETPRYQAFTDLLVRLARREVEVIEIAGNDRILVTALTAKPLPELKGAKPLFEAPVQSREGRRVAIDVAVPQLSETIRALETSGAQIEHIYDY